jgi:hypothetical protein
MYNSLDLARVTEREQFLRPAQSSLWLGVSCSWGTDRARNRSGWRLLSVIIVILNLNNVVGLRRVVPGDNSFMYGLASRRAVVAGHAIDGSWRLAECGRGVCKSPG